MLRQEAFDTAQAIQKSELLEIVAQKNAHINVERLDGEEVEPVCIVNDAMVYNPYKRYNGGVVVNCNTVKEKASPHLKTGNIVRLTSSVWPEDNGLYYIL